MRALCDLDLQVSLLFVFPVEQPVAERIVMRAWVQYNHLKVAEATSQLPRGMRMPGIQVRASTPCCLLSHCHSLSLFARRAIARKRARMRAIALCG